MLDSDYEELPVTGQYAAAMDSLPPLHKDPFDRLLIAQAMVEGITLLTADAVIARYPGPVRKVDLQAVAFAQSSSKARTSSPAICCAVACSITKRCIR